MTNGAISELGELPEKVKRVLVVHGRDGAARRAMFDYLRALGLHPMEWGQLVNLAGGGSPYNGEVVARGLEEVQAAVAIFTPDDLVQLHPGLADGDVEPECQPRPNVILEAGMALARLSDATIIVELGRHRPITDLDGRNVVRLMPEGGPSPLNDLANRLHAAGCLVNRSGNDWLDHERWTSLDAFRRGPDEGEIVIKPSLDSALIADEAEKLAREIHDYLGDRERDDPTRGWATEEEDESRNDEWMRYNRETMRRFAQRYQARALTLLDQLAEVGLASDKDRFMFEHPTNPLGIAEVAMRLGVAAERLKGASQGH